ncbi:MAG: divalent cation tolerance protein CutA [Bauldia sp.]
MLEVHVNFGSGDEASRLSRATVERRLVVAANIQAPIRSFYRETRRLA